MMIELVAEDGHRFGAYRADPPGKPRGAIVVVQEIFGVNSHVRSVADGYAADGYVAIAPAVFDRVEKEVDLGYSLPDIARGREIKAAMSMDCAMLDIAAATRAASHAGKVGVVGYCMGGFLAWFAAAKVPGLACAVPYYGGGITEHAELVPRCPVMFHFGEQDVGIPIDGVRKFAAKHVGEEVFIYPAGHGFNCDERASWDAPSAKLARERTLAFLRTHVG